VVTLTRTVRFAVAGGAPASPAAHGGPGAPQPPTNSFAGHPPMLGLGAHYELDVRCRAEPDPVTGYSLNIKDIDQAARVTIVPAIGAAFRSPRAATTDPAVVLRDALPALAGALAGRLDAVTWRLSPFYSVEMSAASTDRALVRQQFEFAASHRLHVPGLSEQANRDCFGKCNNPSGHGHNYRVEPCVEVPVGQGDHAFSLLDLETITKRTLIDRFDHTNLSVDRPEFIPPAGLNPSVENIAKVCFELLAPEIARAARAVTLRSITVWETDKTSCTYPA
jgi:6-pyruvoyltetrahydropterin/6-carboxytetrahydropterin synthase